MRYRRTAVVDQSCPFLPASVGGEPAVDAAWEEQEVASGGVCRAEDPAHPGGRAGAEENLHVQGVSHVGRQVGDVRLGVDVGRAHHRDCEGVADQSQVVDVRVALQLPGVIEVEAVDHEVLVVGDDEDLPRAELQDPVEGHLEVVAVRLAGDVEEAPGPQSEFLLAGRNYLWLATSWNIPAKTLLTFSVSKPEPPSSLPISKPGLQPLYLVVMTNAYYGFIQTLLPRRDQNCLYINIIIIGIIDYGSHFHISVTLPMMVYRLPMYHYPLTQSMVCISIPWLNMFSWLVTSVEMTILEPSMKRSRARALVWSSSSMLSYPESSSPACWRMRRPLLNWGERREREPLVSPGLSEIRPRLNTTLSGTTQNTTNCVTVFSV